MAIPESPKIQKFNITIPVRIWVKDDMPCVELRRIVRLCGHSNVELNNNLLKLIVSCAFHNTPITFIPTFSDNIRSLSTLIDKGILYYDKDKNEYHYTF